MVGFYFLRRHFLAAVFMPTVIFILQVCALNWVLRACNKAVELTQITPHSHTCAAHIVTQKMRSNLELVVAALGGFAERIAALPAIIKPIHTTLRNIKWASEKFWQTVGRKQENVQAQMNLSLYQQSMPRSLSFEMTGNH